MVEFGDFPNMLVRMLNAAIREPHATLAVFIMQPTGEARLDFIQVGGDAPTARARRHSVPVPPTDDPERSCCVIGVREGGAVLSRVWPAATVPSLASLMRSCRTWSTSLWSCCRCASWRSQRRRCART